MGISASPEAGRDPGTALGSALVLASELSHHCSFIFPCSGKRFHTYTGVSRCSGCGEPGRVARSASGRGGGGQARGGIDAPTMLAMNAPAAERSRPAAEEHMDTKHDGDSAASEEPSRVEVPQGSDARDRPSPPRSRPAGSIEVGRGGRGRDSGDRSARQGEGASHGGP